MGLSTSSLNQRGRKRWVSRKRASSPFQKERSRQASSTGKRIFEKEEVGRRLSAYLQGRSEIKNRRDPL